MSKKSSMKKSFLNNVLDITSSHLPESATEYVSHARKFTRKAFGPSETRRVAWDEPTTTSQKLCVPGPNVQFDSEYSNWFQYIKNVMKERSLGCNEGQWPHYNFKLGKYCCGDKKVSKKKFLQYTNFILENAIKNTDEASFDSTIWEIILKRLHILQQEPRLNNKKERERSEKYFNWYYLMKENHQEIANDYVRKIYTNTKRPLRDIRKETNREKLQILHSNLSEREKAESLRRIQSLHTRKSAGSKKTIKRQSKIDGGLVGNMLSSYVLEQGEKARELQKKGFIPVKTANMQIGKKYRSVLLDEGTGEFTLQSMVLDDEQPPITDPNVRIMGKTYIITAKEWWFSDLYYANEWFIEVKPTSKRQHMSRPNHSRKS